MPRSSNQRNAAVGASPGVTVTSRKPPVGSGELNGCAIRASGSFDSGSPGFRPSLELASTSAPVENSSKPRGWIEWYCQCRSPTDDIKVVVEKIVFLQPVEKGVPLVLKAVGDSSGCPA